MRSVSLVAAIGDIHEEDVLLQHVLEFLVPIAPDVIVAVGDIVDGPGDGGARCCELLADRGVEVVRGNHDRWLLEEAATWSEDARNASIVVDFLEALPAIREYQTELGKILLCHGLGPHDMNRLLPDDYGYALESNDELQKLLRSKEYRYVVNGHTHHRMVRDFGGVTVINTGTLRRDHDSCFAILDFGARIVTFYDIDVSTYFISKGSTHSLR